MRRRNAQTNDRKLVSVPPLQTPRGLELIKSSAKFYANGAGAAKPAIQLSYPVRAASNNPAAERTLSSPAGKLSVPAIAMFCLLLFVLPGLALAAIVWCGTRMVDTVAPEVVAGGTVSDDIIVHRVKTERIDAPLRLITVRTAPSERTHSTR